MLAAARSRTVSKSKPFYGWKLVGVLWLLDFLNMGLPLYCGAVINTYMLKEIPMERGTYGLGFTLLNLFVGLPSTVVAAAILRWSIRTTFVIGSAMILAGILWLSFLATQPWHYLLGFGVIIATGISFGTLVPVTTAVTRWFHRYRGRAMAIPLGASGVAGFIGAPLINRVLAANGGNWRQAWLIVAGTMILAAATAILFVRERPEDLGQIVDGVPPALSTGAGPAANVSSASPSAAQHAAKFSWTPSQVYRTPTYWLIVLGGFACQFPFFLFTAHWILHLRQHGISPADAALAMGLFTMGGIGGRLVGGWLMDILAPRFAFMSGLCSYFVGSLLAMHVDSGGLPVAIAAAILYGVGFGWTFICMNTVTSRYYGPIVFPRINGMSLLITGVVGSPAGVIGGKLFDRFGNYTPAFELNILVAALGIIGLAFAHAPTLRSGPDAITIDSAEAAERSPVGHVT
jgi:MFS family permease